MSEAIRIELLPRGTKRFYALLGPVFGSRAVAREVGIHPYDDADKAWFGAFRGEHLVGWLSVRGRIVSDCYVVEEHRGRGVLTRLLATALEKFAAPLRATCTRASVGVFKKAGFVPVRKTTNFIVMVLLNA
jgi:GNAT superfamily N-acetyltransferase